MPARYVSIPDVQTFRVPEGWVNLDLGIECPACPGHWVSQINFDERTYQCRTGMVTGCNAQNHPFPGGIIYSARPVMQLTPEDAIHGTQYARLYPAPKAAE